jgi:hypothetical protein
MSCDPVDLPEIVAEIREVHDKYEAALSSNDVLDPMERWSATHQFLHFDATGKSRN